MNSTANGITPLIQTTSPSCNGYCFTTPYEVQFLRLLVSLAAWAAWLIRDFPYLLPLGLFMLWSVRRGNQPRARLLADALVWMAGWMVIFLPWPSTLEYFLLPFAAGCAVFCGVAAGQLWSALRQEPSAYLRTLAIAAALLLGITQLNNFTAARFQLANDAVNAHLLDCLAGLPRDSKVYVNVPRPNEYVFEIGVHLAELRGRADIAVDYFDFAIPAPGVRALSYYVATPLFEHETTPLPRHAVSESGARLWNQSLHSFIGPAEALVYEARQQVQLTDFGLQRLLCPWLQGGISCSAPRPLIDTRKLLTGWRVYRVAASVDRVDLPAPLRPDGV